MAQQKLSIAEEFYVRNNPEGLDATALAKRLNKPAKIIQKVLDDESGKRAATEQAEKDKKRGDTMFRNALKRKTDGKGNKGPVVMTPTASQIADATKKKKSNDSPSHVYKPYSE